MGNVVIRTLLVSLSRELADTSEILDRYQTRAQVISPLTSIARVRGSMTLHGTVLICFPQAQHILT
jgi:hypothetical protein